MRGVHMVLCALHLFHWHHFGFVITLNVEFPIFFAGFWFFSAKQYFGNRGCYQGGEVCHCNSIVGRIYEQYCNLVSPRVNQAVYICFLKDLLQNCQLKAPPPSKNDQFQALRNPPKGWLEEPAAKNQMLPVPAVKRSNCYPRNLEGYYINLGPNVWKNFVLDGLKK